MRFGLCLVSSCYRQERTPILHRSLLSLAKTDVDGLEQPAFMMTYAQGLYDYQPFMRLIENKFEALARQDPVQIKGAMPLCIDNSYEVLRRWDDVTHLFFLWDDFVYNPAWLQALSLLIGRKPVGKAWSIYRSRYTRHHRIIWGPDEYGDVKMTMHDGIGCVTREEWLEYANFHNGFDFSCVDGCTPDIHHADNRPGDRWATGRDFIQNLGRHHGIEDVDCAIDFVGE